MIQHYATATGQSSVETPCLCPNTHDSSPASKKRIKTLFRFIFVFSLLFSFSFAVKADSGQPSISSQGFDEYGPFIEFFVPVSDISGYADWVTTGQLFLKTSDMTSRVQVISFTSNDRSGFKANFSTHWGWGRARGNTENNWTGLDSYGTNHVVRDGTSGNQTNLVVRWYVPSYYLDVDLTFSYHEYIDETGTDIGGKDGTFGARKISNPIPPATIGQINFAPTSGKMSVPYSYTGTVGTDNNYLMSHTIGSVTVSDNTTSSPSGRLEVAKSDNPQVVSFTTTMSPQGVNTDSYYFRITQSQSITIPAYQWPSGVTLAYDSTTGIVQVKWNITNLSGWDPKYILKGDDFEIQRSTDNTFPADKTTSYILPYSSSTTSYTKDDDLSDLNIQGTVYYRIRRTLSKNDWEWRENKSAQIAVKTKMLSVTADSVSLDMSDVYPKALLKWKVKEGVWPKGSKFIIRRYSKTSSGQNSSSDINLTDKELKLGTYTDDNLSFCTRYTYSLFVQPGNNNYAAPAEVKLLGEVLAIEMGTVSKFTASKGYFPDRVSMEWHSEGGFSNYVISRSTNGLLDKALQIGTVASTTTAPTDLLFEDSKGTPGVYYTYFIQGVSDCGGINRKSAPLASIGFRSPTGNIYGRITYENGQPVEDVSVRLQALDDASTLGQSIHLDGTAKSYLKIDSLTTEFSDSSSTVETWIKPDDASPVSKVIFSRPGQSEVGFDANGQLYFTYNGQTVTGTYTNPAASFIHVAAIRSKDSLKLMLDDAVIGKAAFTAGPNTNPSKAIYIGSNNGSNNFKGYIDEMRVWNTALSTTKIARDYTRMLAGNERGLAGYWRFDETIKNEFYDLSHTADQYNQNNGVVNDTLSVTRSSIVPTLSQLSLKAYTDSTGNYMITGIPFKGNGTTYTIAPLMGTHQFDPISVNRLISSTTTEFTVDFKDKSAFEVQGFVYYSNSTVPVTGVQFKIDGKYAQESNGRLIETDASGMFTISVPVGTHEVQAVKNNHVFENSGKITNSAGANLNYQNSVSNRILRDSTTVRFIGRVAGGAVQNAYPLGHSASVNNLGKNQSVILGLTSGVKYELNSFEKTVVFNHLLPSNKTDSSKIHKSRVLYQTNQVTIIPDSITGEFVVDLIPEKFLANSVNVTGWGDLLEGKPVSLDLTNKFAPQTSIYDYKDSTQNSDGNWMVKYYSDTVTYNASYKFIKRVTPSVSVIQQDKAGRDITYFGDPIYKSQSNSGRTDSIPVVDLSKTGRLMYNFGYPVFVKNQSYQYTVKAFEPYPFYESDDNGVKVIRQVNGKDVFDNVATTDGVVSVINKIKNGTAVPDTFSLDSKGMGGRSFLAGDPDISAKGLKDFAVSISFGPSTNVNWNWNGDPQMRAYVMGGKQAGTDFVTAGPDQVKWVLRDPPGSASYSYVEQGSSEITTKTYIGSIDQEGNDEKVVKASAEVVTFAGVGAGTITGTSIVSDTKFAIKHEEHFTGTDTKEEVTTLTTRFQTSDKPTFVGPLADVYIGYTTNITYGTTNNITIIRRSDLKASDSLIFDPNPAGNYLLVQRQGIALGETFGTLFAYPQQHIEKVLIPNLIKIRNSVIMPSSTSAADAQSLADNTKSQVYVSKLPPSDPNFGKSNNDVKAFGPAAANALYFDGSSYKIYFPVTSLYRTDTILMLNQYVQKWQDRMADNEKAKVNSKLVQNYSFHAGSPIEYSKETESNTNKTQTFNFVIGLAGQFTAGALVNGAGAIWELNEQISTSHGGEFSQTNSNKMKFGFVLASDGTDDYFSVDVNQNSDSNAGDSSFIFKTRGGVSGCPYEGVSVTKYYQPGTILDQPTQQIEVPRIGVEQPVVNEVPSSRPASFKLQLRNESETKADATFILGYVDNDSIKGATISVDGTPIGGAGRAVVVKYGETLIKEITLTKGPNAMDYNNLMILLHSACQYDPTGYQQNIADTVLISAHFIPSCSDITIKSPKDKWVVNSDAPVDGAGKRYLPIAIDKFDITNSLFDHIELQYKPSSSSTWITSMQFYADSVKYNAAQGEKNFITNASAINYNLVLDDASFNDQNYDIQAVSYCKLGAANYITTESNLVSGIKDTYFPRLFGSPQPANGVLGISDEIKVTFNETIAAGLLTYPDFKVTGIRNGVQGNHTVSVKLDGQSEFVSTEFEKNFAGKNITAEMWVLPVKQANETVFSHGNANESMELSLTSDNRLKVVIGKKILTSDKPFTYKQGEWAHVAMVYNSTSKTVSAFYNFVELIHSAPVDPYAGVGNFEFGRSISKKGDYFNGKMHEVRIWSDTLTSIRLQVNSLTQYSGAENKLLAYYPLSEGKGDISFDKAHGSNAKVSGQWSIPAGKALKLEGTSYAKMNTAQSPITSDMDYTLELWFKGDATQSEATLASNGKGDGTDVGGSLNLFTLGFEKGLLTYQNNGFKVQSDGNYLDNKWHHVALAVNRNSGNAQLLVDGLLKKYFDATSLGGIASASTYLGVRAWHDADSITITKFDRYFKGSVDEFRIWNTYLNQALISRNNNVQLSGNELGLMSYYPFEKYFEFQNNRELGFTLSDMKIPGDPNSSVPDAVAVNAGQTDDMAPIKGSGPVENLKFDFVVNNDALVINMLEPKQAIDKTIITFQVKNVRDLNGNKIKSPITWTAYIDKNQLKWSDDELNLTKDVYAPLQFDSYLVNNGGSVQHYRLDNLPSWLTVDVATGTVDPKGRQKVTFTVNEGLNVGNYDEIVYMRNDNNESEGLALNLYVKGKQPGWTVNPADFKYSMNVYGKIRVNNIFSTNKEDLLAAFINGKCVGVTKNTYNVQNDLWYAYLTVYSDTLQLDKVEFRIWQAGTGKTFLATPSVAVKFSNNAIVGTSVNPVIFDGKEMVLQDITLNENWNWISFNVASTSLDSVNAALRNGRWKSGDVIKNEEMGFDSYSSIAGWTGSLPKLNNTSLFMLNTGNAQTLSISGTEADVKSTRIAVKGNRWSYISYLPQVNMTVKDALAGYNASDEDVIKSQSGFAMYNSRNGWVGNLTYLEPGKGYMLYRKAATDTSFTYPTLNGSLTNHPSGRGANRTSVGGASDLLNYLQTPIAGNYSYAENMTVTAVIDKDFVMQQGDVLLAYVNGELRSTAVAIDNSVANMQTFFLNIAGGAEQPVFFNLERNGQVVAESSTLFNFKTNYTVGTVSKPLVIQLKKQAAGISIYPNPFFSQLSVNVNFKNTQSTNAHALQVSIYDVSGKLVFSRPKAIINGTSYRLDWNGKGSGGTECARGTYFINVIADGELHTYKVIKQ